jgi:hypothetical protein
MGTAEAGVVRGVSEARTTADPRTAIVIARVAGADCDTRVQNIGTSLVATSSRMQASDEAGAGREGVRLRWWKVAQS